MTGVGLIKCGSGLQVSVALPPILPNLACFQATPHDCHVRRFADGLRRSRCRSRRLALRPSDSEIAAPPELITRVMPDRGRMQRFVLLSLAVLALACSGDLSVIVVDEPRVTSVVVTPGADTLTGFWNTTQLSATALDQDGVVMPDAQFVWSSSEPRTAGVDTSGLVTVCGFSTLEPVIITATCEGHSSTAELKVDIAEAFSATFDDAVVDEPPGEPEIGFWHPFDTTAVIVRNTAGDLTNKPVELTYGERVEGGLSGAFPGCGIRTGRWVVQWRSVVLSDSVCFAAVYVQSYDGVLGTVVYRGGGVLTWGSDVTPLAVSWTRGVSQYFELTVDLDRRVLSLSIDNTPQPALQDVPFADTAAGRPYEVGMKVGALCPPVAQTFAWDDIKIVRIPEILPH